MTSATADSHPGWCDPRYCETDGSDGVRHRSTPVEVPIDDEDTQVLLHRCQHDEQLSAPTYELHLCNLAAHEEIAAELTERDVTTLFNRFMLLRRLPGPRR